MTPYRGLAIIFGFYAAGELLSSALDLPIPGSVLGMLLLLGALLSGGVKLEWVDREGELLVKNMSVMFVPPGVGIVTYLALLKSEALPIFGALILSFLVTLITTAKVVETVRRGRG